MWEGDYHLAPAPHRAHAGVKEMLIVDPSARTVEWFVRGESGLDPTGGSRLLDITSAELFDLIDWP